MTGVQVYSSTTGVQVHSSITEFSYTAVWSSGVQQYNRVQVYSSIIEVQVYNSMTGVQVYSSMTGILV